MGWHYLRKNASTGQPGSILVLDTETRPQKIGVSGKSKLHKFRLGHAIAWRVEKGQQTRRKEIAFNNRKRFWEFLEMQTDQKRPVWVFAHNLPFDLTVMGFWDRLAAKDFSVSEPDERLNLRIKAAFDIHNMEMLRRRAGGKKADLPLQKVKRHHGFMCLQDPPTILSLWTRSGRRVVFLDTLNWFRCSLAKLGAQLGLPKMDMPDFDEWAEVWQAYCKNDCLILERAVQNLMAWIKTEDLGMMRYTASAQAMAAYRHKFLVHPICFHDQPETKELERAAYYGGRAWVFKHGLVEGPVHVLDVNSLYPSVMLGNAYPTKLISHEVFNEPENPNNLQLGLNQCATITVQTGRSLPCRLHGQGVRYLAGRFNTSLAGPELDEAVRLGEVVAVHSRATYACSYLFDAYVKYFWRARQAYAKENSHVYADLCKLLLNSLYGKFGQWSPQWEDEPGHRWVKPWGTFEEKVAGEENARLYRAVGWNNQRRQIDREKADSFPAIAAWVTSHGRLKMDRIREAAGPRNVYYQGVDSLHVSDEGFWKLACVEHGLPDGLGSLRSVGTYTHAEYKGPNDYVLDGEIKRAGRKGDAVDLEDGSWEQVNFERLKGIIAEQPKDGIIETSEHLIPEPCFSHGRIGSDGWVQPFVTNLRDLPLTLHELMALNF
jgi:hypothetical protein